MPRFYFRDPLAPPINAEPTVGAIALIEVDGCLLMDRRQDTRTWGLIGGATEPNEPVAETARREVFEETGLIVTSLSLFGTFSDPTRIIEYPDGAVRRVITFAYRATVAAAAELRISEESLRLCYVPLADLPALDIVATHREIIAEYLATRPEFATVVLR